MKKSDKLSLCVMDRGCGTPYDILIPNFFVGMYEMDVFKLSKSGYVTEYEIKISRSDFFNDFKKAAKHELLKAGRLASNRFYFVTPPDLLKPEDIPEYTGWIEISENGAFNILKNAPLLHKKLYTDFPSLARSLAFRERNHRQKVRFYEYEAKRWKEKESNLLKQIPKL